MNATTTTTAALPAIDELLTVLGINALFGAALTSLFITLAFVCDEGLAPALEELSDKARHARTLVLTQQRTAGAPARCGVRHVSGVWIVGAGNLYQFVRSLLQHWNGD